MESSNQNSLNDNQINTNRYSSRPKFDIPVKEIQKEKAMKMQKEKEMRVSDTGTTYYVGEDNQSTNQIDINSNLLHTKPVFNFFGSDEIIDIIEKTPIDDRTPTEEIKPFSPKFNIPVTQIQKASGKAVSETTTINNNNEEIINTGSVNDKDKIRK